MLGKLPTSENPMAKWFYYNENGDKIEVTGGQLKGLAKTGAITPETIVETEDGKKARAGKVQGLGFAPQAESVPSSAPSIPQAPAPTEPLVTLLGIGALLKVFEDKVVVQKEARGSKTLFYNRITSTQFSAAKIGLPGFLQFTFAGSTDLQGVGEGAVLSAIADENSFVFLAFQNQLVEAVRDFVDAKIGGIDQVNERNNLFSCFVHYTGEVNKLHYSIASNGKILEVYGDHVNIDSANIDYVGMLCVSSELNVPTLEYIFGEAKQNQQGKLAFNHVSLTTPKSISFGMDQNNTASAIARYLSNTVGLKEKAPESPLDAWIACIAFLFLVFVLYCFVSWLWF